MFPHTVNTPPLLESTIVLIPTKFVGSVDPASGWTELVACLGQ